MVRRYDRGNLSKIQRTPNGGIRVDANLTRTGIFEYRNEDGSIRREYRPASEVFAPASLASFRGVPVTVGHPGLVTSKNFGSVACGHVGDDVRGDGKFLIASVVIQRDDAVSSVERKDLSEVSCGYNADIDWTSGEFEGQPYDAVQRNIRGNHVALLPKGTGRGGREVALRLDSNGNAKLTGMPTDNGTLSVDATNVKVRVDGQGEIDKLKAENEMLRAENAQLKDPKRFDSAVASRIALVQGANKHLGAEFKSDGLSDREIKVAVIKTRKADFVQDGKSDDFVNAAYEMALAFEPQTPVNAGLAKLRADANTVQTAPDTSGLNKAYLSNVQASLDAWKKPLSTVKA